MHKEYNEKFNFFHLISEDGMVITNYTENLDIVDYSSAKEMYCPSTTDLSVYYEITDEQDAEYKRLQEIALEEQSKNELEKE